MLKQIINYLKNNQIDCHADKSARNDRVCHYGRFAFYRKSAFTLAETLIVMGIIGVVAALTLPNLNSSTGDKEKVVKVKKVYQNLTDAVGRAQAVYGSIDEWKSTSGLNGAITDTFVADERISEFMKLSKNCSNTTNQNCFDLNKKIKFTNNTESSLAIANTARFYKFITSDGTSIAIDDNKFEKGLTFYVDIDGPNKGQFRLGSDVFRFFSNSPYFELEPERTTFSKILYDLKVMGFYSSAWIIDYGNMDYLKFTDKNGTYPNGTTVTESNPTCK